MRSYILPFALMAPLALAACQQETDPGPGGVTVGEAEALDEAAEMLEAGRPELPPEIDAPAAEIDQDAPLAGQPDALPSPENSGGPQPATLPDAG